MGLDRRTSCEKGVSAVEYMLIVAFLTLCIGALAPQIPEVLTTRLLIDFGGGTGTTNPGGACEVEDGADGCVQPPAPGAD